MRKILIVAFREFWQRVRSRGFILTTLGLPLLLLIIWGVSTLGGGDGGETAETPLNGDITMAVGYVDHADLITSIPPGVPEGVFVSYPDETSASEALENGEIEVYFVIPANYRETGEIQRVSEELPAGPPETDAFNWLLTTNLLPDVAPEEFARLRAPFQSPQLRVVQVDAAGEATVEGDTVAPFLVAMLVMIPLFMSGSYLLQSVTQEKSNRVMEMLLVSLRPRDLLGGKLLGLGALTLVQYLVWIAIGMAVLHITGQDISSLTAEVNLSPVEILLVLVYGLGGYALYAAMMAGVGALSPDLESSRSWIFLISLPMVIPIYLWTAIIADPNGALAVILSLIPFSSPLAMLMRMASTSVPVWQVVASIALVALTVIGVIWLMSRLFRAQTLLSGESFSPGRFWAAMTQR